MVSLRPYVFGGIEFGRVCGEVVPMESGMRGKKSPDLTPAMNRAAIPEQVDRAAQMA
jgi:hypothetical protein